MARFARCAAACWGGGSMPLRRQGPHGGKREGVSSNGTQARGWGGQEEGSLCLSTFSESCCTRAHSTRQSSEAESVTARARWCHVEARVGSVVRTALQGDSPPCSTPHSCLAGSIIYPRRRGKRSAFPALQRRAASIGYICVIARGASRAWTAALFIVLTHSLTARSRRRRCAWGIRAL